MTERPTFDSFKADALSNPAVRDAYDALEDDYQLKRRMITLRKAAGLTQEQMAEKLGMRKPAKAATYSSRRLPPGPGQSCHSTGA